MTAVLALSGSLVAVSGASAATLVLDQSTSDRGTGYLDTSMTQTFTAGKSGPLAQVVFWVAQQNHGGSVRILDASGHTTLATGRYEATSASITKITVNFDSPATVSAGTQYALAIGFDGGAPGVTVELTNDVYAGGALYSSQGIDLSLDIAFRTYIGVGIAGPTNLTTSRTDGELSVSWAASADEASGTGYEVRYRPVGGSAWTETVVGIATSVHSKLFTGVSNTTAYEVQVRLTTSSDASDWVAVQAAALPVPALTVSLLASPGAIDVSWAQDSSRAAATSAEVQYKLSSAGWSTATSLSSPGVPAAGPTTISGLTNGTLYDVRVRGVNASGTGDWSDVRSATPATVPTVVQSLTATSLLHEVDFSWSAPASDGGSAVVRYEYTCTPGCGSGSTTQTSFAATGLTGTGTISLSVVAVNGVGSSSPAALSGSPYDAPGAVTGLAASGTGDSGTIDVSWTAPASTGGRPIDHYTVEWKPTSSPTWASRDVSSASTSITGLVDGAPYDVRVTAVTDVASGLPVATTGTPYTVPGTPTDVVLDPGDGTIDVSWIAPVFDGGATLDPYAVRYREVGAPTWTLITTPATALTLTSLVDGTAYEVEVSAVNAAGESTPASGGTATPYRAPDAPTGLTVTEGDGQLALDWTAPAFDGGRTVSAYRIEYRLLGDPAWTSTDTSSPITTTVIDSLTNGAQYEVRVSAVNVAGAGDPSSIVDGSPLTVASAPTDVTLAAGAGGIRVDWTAPLSDGGRAITGYRVEYRAAGATTWDGVDATGTSALVTGLHAATTYEVRVSAQTAAGLGLASTSATATTPAVAVAPTGLSATPGDGTAQLTWSAPAADGGSAVTGYLVEYRTGSAVWSPLEVASTRADLEGLTDGAVYEVRVSAVNAVGIGAPSAVATVTPFGAGVSFTTSGGSLDGAEVHRNDSITVTGSRLPAGAIVTIVMHSVPVTLGTATASPDGVVSLRVVVPGEAKIGDHRLVASVTSAGVTQETTATFAVVRAAASGSAASGSTVTPTGSTLASTGLDLEGPLGLAALLLALGAVLVLRRRRAEG